MNLKPGMNQEYNQWRADQMKGDLSTAIVNYGETWANQVETDMNNGQTFDQACGPAQLAANAAYGQDQMTYSCAVSMLFYFWQKGDKLQTWHNKRFGFNKRNGPDGLVFAQNWTVN